MPEERESLTEVLRKAIRSSGMTQRAIFLATGVRENKISRFLNDMQTLSLDNCDKLCRFLKLKLVREVS